VLLGPFRRSAFSIQFEVPFRFGDKHMKKIIASLATVAIALVSVQAFAQASDAAAPAAAASTPKKHHKQLKHHGKRAKVQEAASAAGTADKGAQQ
jgi:hypothetical protein